MHTSRRRNPFLLLPLIGVLGLSWNLASDFGWGETGDKPDTVQTKQLQGPGAAKTAEAESADKKPSTAAGTGSAARPNQEPVTKP
ncbi:hypothetical protein J31TS4_04680 [Paenibacillus sp. J31TS4]|uniref:hypothetical protein n=1 Tax=Paenibacillus sp. J31TS4 TaxID=2807195 RepID=UPI001B1B1884|nr:hypothetical protein [Paenibacillus sp. J31TS4]GIP37188.1 hypothetical protein J31TS4_04680 [Paenibacillus sp. J31TS4]